MGLNVVTTTPCPLLQLTASTTPEQCGDCRNRGEIQGPTDQPGGGVRGAAVAVAGTKARVAGLAAHLLPPLFVTHNIQASPVSPLSEMQPSERGKGSRTVHLPTYVTCLTY